LRRGVKVLSLFFYLCEVGEVSRLRPRRMKRVEYLPVCLRKNTRRRWRELRLGELPLEKCRNLPDPSGAIDVAKTHVDYFSIDKKGRMTDPKDPQHVVRLAGPIRAEPQ